MLFFVNQLFMLELIQTDAIVRPRYASCFSGQLGGKALVMPQAEKRLRAVSGLVARLVRRTTVHCPQNRSREAR